MNSLTKKAALAVFAAAVGFGVHNTQAAAVIVENGQSATVGGWTVSAPTGVSLSLDGVSNNTLDIEKTANFQSTNGFLVTFSQASSSAVPFIDFKDEAIANNSGSDWSGFQFLLLNTSSSPATFDGLGNVFVPPTGTGVDYTGVSLNSSKNVLAYTGTQVNGSISNWGSSAVGDNLLIDANPGSGFGSQDFSFKELPETGGGGTVVPLPAAAWQGLVGLAGLGVIAAAKKKFKTA